MNKDIILEASKELFKIVHTFEKKDWAPGIWAGCEGLTLEIIHINLEKRTITLNLKKNT